MVNPQVHKSAFYPWPDQRNNRSADQLSSADSIDPIICNRVSGAFINAGTAWTAINQNWSRIKYVQNISYFLKIIAWDYNKHSFIYIIEIKETQQQNFNPSNKTIYLSIESDRLFIFANNVVLFGCRLSSSVISTMVRRWSVVPPHPHACRPHPHSIPDLVQYRYVRKVK